MSLEDALEDVVSSATEEVTNEEEAAIEEEEAEAEEEEVEKEEEKSQEESQAIGLGNQDLITAIGTVVAGTAVVSKAMVGASLGLTKGMTSSVTGVISAACNAGSPEEALGAMTSVLKKSMAGQFAGSVKDFSKGSKMVVKGFRHGIGAIAKK